MQDDVSIVERLVAPSVTFAVAVVIGILIQILVNTRLRKIAERTPWKGDNIIVEGLKGKIIIWAVIIGLHSALPMLHLSPEYHHVVEKALLVLIILLITITAASMASNYIKVYSSGAGGEIISASIVSILSKIVVMSIGLMIILQSLDISITPILTALGVGGLAVALALQDTLGNLFAGVTLILSKKVKVGDYVRIQSGEEGYVMDVTWRNTTVRQLSDNHIIIPNSRLASSITTNYSLPQPDMWVTVQLGVAYDSDLENVERVTLEVAQEVVRQVEGGAPQREPSIRFNNFAESSISFTVSMSIKEYSKQYLIKHEFIKMLHRKYAEEGIVIPFPVRTLEFAEGARISTK